MGRPVAAVVAGVSVAAFTGYSSLLLDDWNAWLVAVVVALGTGAAFLTAGVIVWFGVAAWRLRAIGLTLVFWGSVATVSFAFALVPLALLAVPSLRNFERERDPLVSGRAGLV